MVALSSKGNWSYDEPPFPKRKALYLLVNCIERIFYVFPSTKLFLYLVRKRNNSYEPYGVVFLYVFTSTKLFMVCAFARLNKFVF